jgi:membrane-associated protease RseP (regulator of RpoE activity)
MEEETKAKRPWLNLLLFIFTCFSVFIVGLTWSVSYVFSDQLTLESQSLLTPQALTDPRVIGLSLVYAVVLIIILLGHEMGHYLTCRYYHIEATLPFFIPIPLPPIGTLGAFIKIKSPITLKKQLFDIGVSGPLAGFCLALPALIYGVSLSKVVPHLLPREDTLYFGEPLLLKLISSLLFRNVPAEKDLFLHPLAIAGWVGILVTALNLLPIGQLDGGHISYAFIGRKSKPLSRLLMILFFLMSVFFWAGWIVWGLAILLLGLKHPRVINENESLSLSRRVLGIVVVAIFIFSFIPAPLKGSSLLELAKQWGLL